MNSSPYRSTAIQLASSVRLDWVKSWPSGTIGISPDAPMAMKVRGLKSVTGII